MSLLSFWQRFNKNRKAIYLLYGDDRFLFLEAIDYIRAFIPEDERIFSLEIYDCKEMEGIGILTDTLRTPSFFGKEKTVVIDNLQSLKNEQIKEFSSILETIRDYTVVLLYRDRSIDKVRDLLNMAIHIQLNLYEKDIPQWLKKIASMHGIDISDNAISYMIEYTGSEPGLLKSELLKLYSSGIKRFDITEIKDILTPYSDYDLNDLISQIKMKNKCEIIKIIRAINIEPEIIIGAINRHFSKMPEYQELIESLFNLTIKAKIHREFFDISLIRLLEN